MQLYSIISENNHYQSENCESKQHARYVHTTNSNQNEHKMVTIELLIVSVNLPAGVKRKYSKQRLTDGEQLRMQCQQQVHQFKSWISMPTWILKCPEYVKECCGNLGRKRVGMQHESKNRNRDLYLVINHLLKREAIKNIMRRTIYLVSIDGFHI